MKHYFITLCILAFKANPVEWEWELAMAQTKNRYPKSGVNRSVFERKWLNEAKTQIWELIKQNDIVNKYRERLGEPKKNFVAPEFMYVLKDLTN